MKETRCAVVVFLEYNEREQAARSPRGPAHQQVPSAALEGPCGQSPNCTPLLCLQDLSWASGQAVCFGDGPSCAESKLDIYF